MIKIPDLTTQQIKPTIHLGHLADLCLKPSYELFVDPRYQNGDGDKDMLVIDITLHFLVMKSLIAIIAYVACWREKGGGREGEGPVQS